MRRATLCAAVAVAVTSTSAQAKPKPVTLTANGPKPSVATIAPGGTVRWTNTDAVAHQLAGAFSSPLIQPGKTFDRAFPHTGEYRYRDTANAAYKGTVIVEAASGRPDRPPSGGSTVVMHDYRGVVTLAVDETYKFYDGEFRTFDGPCNGEVGKGSRTLRLRVTFPHVTYTHAGTTEVLHSTARPGQVDPLRESVDAMVANDSTPETDCGDGTTDRAPAHHVRCSAAKTGTLGRFTLGWSPSAKNRFLLNEEQHMDYDVCGLEYVGPLSIAGVKSDAPGIPLQLLAQDFAYDLAETSPATSAEVRAMRTGRHLRVERSLNLDFLANCCSGWLPKGDNGGILARVGSLWTLRATLTIELKPN